MFFYQDKYIKKNHLICVNYTKIGFVNWISLYFFLFLFYITLCYDGTGRTEEGRSARAIARQLWLLFSWTLFSSILTPLFLYFSCFFDLFHSCCPHVRVFGKHSCTNTSFLIAWKILPLSLFGARKNKHAPRSLLLALLLQLLFKSFYKIKFSKYLVLNRSSFWFAYFMISDVENVFEDI